MVKLSSEVYIALAVGFILGMGIMAGVARIQAQSPLAEGILFSARWETGKGGTEGVTRSNLPEAVPGGTGSFNMDMSGRLFTTHLEIENRRVQTVLRIIPFHRLVEVQFGDGGIKSIAQP
ncbi:MAG TPA: hypothetical protein PK878_16680 [bacterium]|nr:hypothetical protein [Candidatus Omnitrophota bacterium]HOJ61920.1 hypothetical protein [bacterium]HOL94642.1 hypothetical protein [bacterium]HPP02369.1 hypothetical protein [bacterium]HXK92413.1 hypothetical protein [bacterium]